MTEDIITRLSAFSSHLVFARNSTSKYKGQEVDASTVGEELGADYVVEGSVRRAEGQLRVTVQMLDARDGTNLWAKTYDRDLTAKNVFEVSDAITEGIVNAIGDAWGVIARTELARALRDAPNSLTVVECHYMLSAYYVAPAPEKHLKIRSCFEKALEADPDSPLVHSGLAWAYRDEFNLGFNTQPNPLESALRAIELDPNNADAHQIKASIHFHRRELDAAMISAERAVALNPHSAHVLADMGFHIGFGGKLERGATLIEKAIVMNPATQPWYHYLLSHHYIMKEDYDTALDHALRLTWGLSWDYMYRVVIYARSGRMAEARAEAAKLLEAHPTYPQDARGEYRKFYFPEDVIESYLDSMREAGIDFPPDDAPTN